MATFGTKLKQLREERGLTQAELAEILGTSKQVISRYETNQRTPKITVAKEYAERLDVNLSYLIDNGEDTPAPLPQGYIPMPETERRPIIGDIACGTPITAEQNIQGYANVPTDAGADFCLVCKGDSMIDAGICDGDIVCIRQQERVENGQIAAVRVDNEATLKRFYFDGSKVTLMPANGAYAPMTFVGDEINQLHIEGLAVGFYHRL